MFTTNYCLALICSDLSEKSHVPLHPIWIVLLDLRVEHLNDIIHHLTSDLIAPIAGTQAASELIGRLEDLKGSKPAWTVEDEQLL